MSEVLKQKIINEFLTLERSQRISVLFLEYQQKEGLTYDIWFSKIESELRPFLGEISLWNYQFSYYGKEIRDYPDDLNTEGRKKYVYEDNAMFFIRAVDNYLMDLKLKIKNKKFEFTTIDEFKNFLILGITLRYRTQRKMILDAQKRKKESKRKLKALDNQVYYDNNGEIIETSRFTWKDEKIQESKSRDKNFLLKVIFQMNEIYGIDNLKKLLANDKDRNRLQIFIEKCIDLLYYKYVYHNKKLTYNELVHSVKIYEGYSPDTLRNLNVSCNSNQEKFIEDWSKKIKDLIRNR